MRLRRANRAFLLLALLGGCTKELCVTEPTTPEPALTIQVVPTAPEIVVGDSIKLDAVVNLSGGTIVWQSAAPTTASVSSTGRVYGIAAGTTQVSATVTRNGESKSASATVTVRARSTPTPITVNATPDTVRLQVGQTQTASAVVSGPPGVSQAVRWFSNGVSVATVNASGLITAIFAGTTTVVAEAVADNSARDAIVVIVTAAPPPPTVTVTISANPTTVSSGGSTTITWSSTNATSCTASSSPSNTAWTGTKSLTGSQGVAGLTATTAFNLSCSGPGGSVTQGITVTVNAPPPPTPVITFSANPTNVANGGSSTLTWSATNATSCSASASPANSQWSGTQSVSGNRSITNLTATTTFTITCTGAGGSASQTAVVTVAAPPAGFIRSIVINPTRIDLTVGQEFTFTVTVTGDAGADLSFTCAPTPATTSFIQVVAVTATTCRVRALKAYTPGADPRPSVVARTNGRTSTGFQLEAGAFVDTRP